MTEDQARNMIRQLLALQRDVDRFNKIRGVLAGAEEIKSSADAQAGAHSFAAHKRMREIENQLVKLLCGAPDVLSSAGEINLNQTTPRV